MSSRTIGIAVALAAAVSLPAAAQDALGRGDALDANLSTRGRTNEAVPDIDFAGRNLLITRDVAGGRGFRGAVGYRAAGDFSGRLPSNETLRFRRDSVISAPGFDRFEAMDTYSYGQQLGALEYRRSGTSTTVGGLVAASRWQDPDDEIYAARYRLDRIQQSVTLADTMRGAAEPAFVGRFADTAGNPLQARISGVTGVTYARPASDLESLGLTSYDRARLYSDRLLTGREEEIRVFEGRIDRLRDPARAAGNVEGGRQDTRVDDSDARYLDIVERVARRYAESEGIEFDVESSVLESAEARIQRVRDQLQRIERGAPGPEPEPADEEDPDSDEPGDEPAALADLPIEEIAAALDHGVRLENLTGSDSSRFTELLNSGEQNLRSGEYFIAERHFSRALRFRPGHPLATAGLAHAQIGAGTYLSAALTLRSLFTHQPEMIDVRYADTILPNNVRMSLAIDALRERSERARDRELYGFLLAYIGHQREDQALITEGLDQLEEVAPDDPLLPILRRIWQDSPSPKTDSGSGDRAK